MRGCTTGISVRNWSDHP